LFFNRKVLKPVKGGGKGMPAANPYGGGTIAIRPTPANQAVSFSDFKNNIQGPQKSQRNKVAPTTLLLGNSSAPLVKPEF
jgi:hypothetical protein